MVTNDKYRDYIDKKYTDLAMALEASRGNTPTKKKKGQQSTSETVDK